MNAREPLAGRLVELLPVFAALNLHAVAHERHVLAFALQIVLAVVLLARLTLSRSVTWFILGGLGGGLAGFALAIDAPPAPGPIPVAVLGPLTGMLAGFAVSAATARNLPYAWTFACALAATSLDVPSSPPLVAAMSAMAGCLLVAAYARANVGASRVLGPSLFLAMVGAATALGLFLADVVRQGEGVLVDTIGRLWDPDRLPDSVSLRPNVMLFPRSDAEGSRRALLEVSGDAPDHLRTTVLDRFDGGGWSTSAELQAPVAEPDASFGVPYEVTLLADLTPYIPAPATTRGRELEGGFVLRGPAPRGATLQLTRTPEERLPAEQPNATTLEVPPKLAGSLRPHALRLAGDATTARQKAARIAAHFQSSYEYSLRADLLVRGKHPLLVLLDERRPAYCTWFAAATAALLRTVGVHTRLAAGFLVTERNPFTGRAVLRARDAHAWVEFWDDAAGRFVAIDPTPSQGRDDALQIDRTPGFADAALGWLGSALRRALASPLGTARALVTSPVTIGLALAGLAWMVWRRRGPKKAKRERVNLRAADPALADAYKTYMKTLRRGAGIEPDSAESDDELLARVRAAAGPPAADAAREFLASYRAARYGGAPPPREALAAQLTRLRSALESARPPNR